MHWHHVHKIVEFDEIAQAHDELSFCVWLLWNTHYETILLRHLPQLISIFNTSKRSHASLHPGKARSCKQPLILLFQWVSKLSLLLNTVYDCIKHWYLFFDFFFRLSLWFNITNRSSKLHLNTITVSPALGNEIDFGNGTDQGRTQTYQIELGCLGLLLGVISIQCEFIITIVNTKKDTKNVILVAKIFEW